MKSVKTTETTPCACRHNSWCLIQLCWLPLACKLGKICYNCREQMTVYSNEGETLNSSWSSELVLSSKTSARQES